MYSDEPEKESGLSGVIPFYDLDTGECSASVLLNSFHIPTTHRLT